MENKVNYIKEGQPEGLYEYYESLERVKKAILKEIDLKPTRELYERLNLISEEMEATADELINSTSIERKIRR